MMLTARLAEAGASDAQIESLIPHSSTLTKFYRRHASQRLMAADAIALLPDRVPSGK